MHFCVNSHNMDLYINSTSQMLIFSYYLFLVLFNIYFCHVGFKSWVRSYASYPKSSREVFNFKDCHLGHYAKSFALRDAPRIIGGIGKPKKDPRMKLVNYLLFYNILQYSIYQSSLYFIYLNGKLVDSLGL